MLRAALMGWSTGLDFDLAWFSFLSTERLCVFILHGSSFFSLYFTFQSAEHDGIGLDLVY